MIPEAKFEFITGIRRFGSMGELRLYFKQLLDAYEKEYDKVSALTGDLLRDEDMEAAKARSKGWFKAGNIFANKTDTARAGLDIMLQVMKETRPKITSLRESLKSFEQMENLPIAEKSTLLLYIREGVPERLVIGPPG